MAYNSIYIVDNLIGSLKLRGLPPTSQNTFQLADFAQVLSEELQTNIVPLMDSVSQEYFVTNMDYTYDPAITAYAIPPRAVGGKLRDVVFVDTTGTEIAIPRLRPEDIKARSMSVNFQASPWGFYLKDESVVIYSGSTGASTTYPTLRLKYFRRPNILTLSANAGQISSIAGNLVTLTNVPASWTTANTFDITKGSPNFISNGDDLAITLINGFVLTFSSLPSSVAVGDWVALSNYSPIPQIPVDGHYLLAQYATAKCLEAMGDAQGVQMALQKAEMMKNQFLMIISPRTEGTPFKLTSRGGIGDLCDL